MYTADAVSAILIGLVKAKKNGDIYNVANEATYCTIAEMAELVTKLDPSKSVKVKYEFQDNKVNGYAPTLHMNLDCSKIRNLGWTPTTDLKQMYQRMILDMEYYYRGKE